MTESKGSTSSKSLPANHHVIEISEDEEDTQVFVVKKTLTDSDASSVVSKTLTLAVEEKGCAVTEFDIGDFVWAYVPNYVCGYFWLPCRILDPSAATEDTAKLRNNESDHLVYYFGDRNIGWQQPTELKPFAENFEEFSKQTEWRLFIEAVDEAFDEVCSMMKSKLLHQDMDGAQRIINKRLRPEVVTLLPEGCIGKAIDEFINQPENIISCVRNAARLGCTYNLLEKALMKNWSFATGINPLKISYELIPKAENGTKRERVSDVENGKSSSRRTAKRSRYLSYPFINLPDELELDDGIMNESENVGLDSKIGCVKRKLEKLVKIVEERGAETKAAKKKVVQHELMELQEMVKKTTIQVQRDHAG